MRVTEKKAGAVALILVGLFMLLKVPERWAVWMRPHVVDAPSFDKLGMELMIAGGVMVLCGAAVAWLAWREPRI